jgi:hypothetical protein
LMCFCQTIHGQLTKPRSLNVFILMSPKQRNEVFQNQNSRAATISCIKKESKSHIAFFLP